MTRATLAAALLVLAGRCPAAAAEASADEALARSVFLGQAYQSGRIYLLGVHGEDQPVDWPKTLRVRPMTADGAKSPVREAAFSQRKNVNGEYFSNFRNEETPKAERDSPRRKSDFFDYVLDGSVEDPDVGVYASSEKWAAPEQVVAWHPDLALEPLDFSLAGKARPMTAKEGEQAAAHKAAKEKAEKGDECTTIPHFRDDAKQLWSAKLKGRDASLRLSKYSDPGCAGHLAEIYLLDVIRSGAPAATFEITHYFGAI